MKCIVCKQEIVFWTPPGEKLDWGRAAGLELPTGVTIYFCGGDEDQLPKYQEFSRKLCVTHEILPAEGMTIPETMSAVLEIGLPR